MKKLIIISGFSHGSIAWHFYDFFSNQENSDLIALTRNKSYIEKYKNAYELDLSEKDKCLKFVKSLDLSKYSEIYFLHLIGKWTKEEHEGVKNDHDNDGIEDDILHSNVTTFKNIVEPLVEKIKQEKDDASLYLCGFGSISDKYMVPFWQSASKSKNILRNEIQNLAYNNSFVCGFVFNVSSVNTENERNVRPYADTTHWLQPEEMLNRIKPFLFECPTEKYLEVDIFNPMPDFDESWYTDHEGVVKRRMKQMYDKS
jgi:hypothetical protein